MAFNGSYLLTYAGVPFCSDRGEAFEVSFTRKEIGEEFLVHFGGESRPEPDVTEEVNRLIPFEYLNDFAPPSAYPGRNLGAIAHPNQGYLHPTASIKVGQWYYPTNASRWSICRFLATSAMVKIMLSATEGFTQRILRMKAFPDAPTGLAESAYSISTNMYMLPPRSLSELGGTFDGLFLVTLVDDRWYHRNTPVSLRVTKDTAWTDLLADLADALAVTLNFSAIPSVYGKPEPDSQLWTNAESAAVLLDAVAWNIGRVVVRKYDGTYSLLTYDQSIAQTALNRPNQNTVVRLAGGDMFSTTANLPAGSLAAAKNSILPANIIVTFPKYVRGDDPVPHFLNSRYTPQRPSSWYEESYGETYDVIVPISSGPASVQQSVGVSETYIHTTAKALLETEGSVVPTNASGLDSLALQLARDHWNAQAGAALDEVYPGTLAWEPEGYHDILWTYSDKRRLASTRVMRAEWNQTIVEMQHSAPALSGETNIPRGVGGPSVAQTWLDEAGLSNFSVNATLNGALLSGAFTAALNTIDNLPTQYRWKGQVNNEVILFEGTSGGVAVGIVYRGIDGTVQTAHNNGDTVSLLRNTIYGTNLVRTEKMQFAYPGRWQSGGIQEAVQVPQTQTVHLQSASGVNIGGTTFYSGQVQTYNPTDPSFTSEELVWIQERNADPVISGKRYDGQFAGFSKSGPVAPIYLVNAAGSGTAGGGGSVESGTLQWFHFVACGLSGINCSGFINHHHLFSGLITNCHSGMTHNCTSGYPSPLLSGIYNTISGYPYAIQSGIWNVTSGYPYPLISGIFIFITDYPYPITSGIWDTVSGYPFPVQSGIWNLISGYPFPVQSGNWVVQSGSSVPVLSGSTGTGPGSPSSLWRKFTVTHTDFDAGASVTIHSLGEKEVAHDIIAKHSASFTGGAISAFTIDVEVDDTVIIDNFDVFTAPAAAAFAIAPVNQPNAGSVFFQTGRLIEVVATATGGTPADATAGSVDVWVLLSTLP